MRFTWVSATAATALSVVGGTALAQQPPQPPGQPQPQQVPQQVPDRPRDQAPADADRLHIFVVSAAVAVTREARGRSTPCEITSIVRALCSAPNGASRPSCEITDGQIGAREGNLFVEPYRTDILQSCGITSLSSINAFGISYVCRGAWSSQTVGQVTHHERPVSFTASNDPRQSPPWRIIMLCR